VAAQGSEIALTDSPLDLTALRTETARRLKQLETPTKTQPVNQPLRDLLVERQLRLDEYDHAAKELHTLGEAAAAFATHTTTAKAEIERLKVQSSQSPQNLLPAALSTNRESKTQSTLGEIKEAIERAKHELKSAQAKLEAGRSERSKTKTQEVALRAERDRLYQRVATLKALSLERETNVTAAKSEAARHLARDRLTNMKMESRLEALRLQVVEARLAQAPKIAELNELNHHILEAQTQISRKLLDHLERRYQELGEIQENELKRAAAAEESKAKKTDNPLERYRGRRLSELLDLEVKVIKNEQTLATSTHPTLEEARSLADRAANDFAQIKQLLDDGNVSRLDALRLNNDFRRIGPERDRLLKNELGTIEAQLQFYENMLTEVELELIEESVADQVEHEAVLERLPVDRHDAARKEFADLESKHRALLERRRAALSKLVARASETMEQVTRRLNVLEDEYGFIKTHIFWVRDQEPVGSATLTQSGRELRRLVRSLLKLAREASDPDSWGSLSTEFLTAAMAVLALPLGLFRVRRVLRRRITRALPPSHLHGITAETIRVDMSAAIGQR
jgi:potassium efflux system protein